MPDEETEDPYEDFRKEPRPIIQEPAEAMVFPVLLKVSCRFKITWETTLWKASGSAADVAEVELEEPISEPKPAPAPATTQKPAMKPVTEEAVVITEKVEQTTLPEIAKGGIFDGHSGATTQPENGEILAIPIWVWILVAIIGVIVILCIVLVMTRYVW